MTARVLEVGLRGGGSVRVAAASMGRVADRYALTDEVGNIVASCPLEDFRYCADVERVRIVRGSS